MSKRIRFRSANFTREEVKLLFTIVNDLIHIVESKKTDAVTWKAKEAAWETIASRYNASIGRGGVQRNSQSLKKCWGNRHRKIKQMFAKERIESLRWGGDMSVQSAKEPQEELMLTILNDKKDTELYEQFDIDIDAELLADSSTAPLGSPSSDSADSNDSEGSEERELHLNCKTSANIPKQGPREMPFENVQRPTHSKPWADPDIKNLMEIKLKSAELQRKLLEQELKTKLIEDGLKIQIMQQKLVNMKQENELNSLQLRKHLHNNNI